MRSADLQTFVLIYDCPNEHVTVREFDNYIDAVLAFEELDPDGFGGIYDVTIVQCESVVTLERIYACPVRLGRVAA